MINLDLIICVDSVVKKIEREAELRDSTTSENRRRDWKKKRVKGKKVDSDLSIFNLSLSFIYIYIIINGGQDTGGVLSLINDCELWKTTQCPFGQFCSL